MAQKNIETILKLRTVISNLLKISFSKLWVQISVIQQKIENDWDF